MHFARIGCCYFTLLAERLTRVHICIVGWVVLTDDLAGHTTAASWHSDNSFCTIAIGTKLHVLTV